MSTGQKVTSDPETLQNPKNENPGIVASDSLAGESIREGGSFAANSDSRGPMDQPARSLNANTTDTSNATTLDPAPDAEARDAASGWAETAQLKAAQGLGKESGVGPTWNASKTQTTSEGNGAPAPSYASNPASDLGDNFKPKGKNLQEGFNSSAPNGSWSTDIGGRGDPGRVALGRFEEQNVPVAGGAGPRQEEITRDGQFSALDETSA